MMTLKAPTVGQKCQSIEFSIAEAVRTIATTRAQLESAESVGAHAKMASTIDFTETRRRSLIAERLALEESRLAEVAANAKAAHEAGPGAELGRIAQQRKALEAQLRAIEKQFDSAQTRSSSLQREMYEAQAALNTWRSPNQGDTQIRADRLRDLRERLDALG